MMSWAQPALESTPAALLGQQVGDSCWCSATVCASSFVTHERGLLQASFEEHTRDTEIDAPMAHLSLQNLQVRG